MALASVGRKWSLGYLWEEEQGMADICRFKRCPSGSWQPREMTEGRVDEDPRLRWKMALGSKPHADTKHNHTHFMDEELKLREGKL